MNRQTLPLNAITVPERFRKDYGDLSLLKDSISRYGLIQPIVITQDRMLIAGGRRYRAHCELGLANIDVVYKETLSESERLDMEALENIARKSFSWQEECIAIARIHRQRQQEAALQSETWNTRLACELFGMGKGTLDYVLIVAKKLEAELGIEESKRKYHSYNSCNEAYRLGYLGEVEAQALAELATRHRALSASTAPIEDLVEQMQVVEQTKKADSSPDLLAAERARYEANPLNKTPFDEYWSERQRQKAEFENTIYLSNRLLHGDCIDWMNHPDNAGSIDHILTDIPYGIDMEMLNQQNSHGGLQDLDRVEKEHDVKENETLMAKFFPAAFKCTKEKAFVITYLDIMQWQYCYDLACNAGFAVQRWPLIWHKQSGGMNQCASYNSTKNYDILMLCRKPGTTLTSRLTSSIILASSEDAKTSTGHPFSKPFAVTKQLADAVSIKGNLFLEPFAGRGSITIELLRQERRVIAVEKQDEHYNALLENVKRFYLALNPKSIFK